MEVKVNGKMSYQELLDTTLEVKWVDGTIEINEVDLKYLRKNVQILLNSQQICRDRLIIIVYSYSLHDFSRFNAFS